jgi:hypothetical protein
MDVRPQLQPPSSITKPEPPHLPGVKYFEKLAAPHVRPTAVWQASAVVI